jgi:hypothetical protein
VTEYVFVEGKGNFSSDLEKITIFDKFYTLPDTQNAGFEV